MADGGNIQISLFSSTKKKKVKLKKIDGIPDNRANAHTVRDWFREGRSRLFASGFVTANGYIESGWGIKESTLAKKLLLEYGDELVKKAVDCLCDEWPTYSFDGLPGINLLYSIRARIFDKVQVKKKKIHAGAEYNADKAGDSW